MNQEIKTKWVTALRSGKYKQCKKLLRHAGRHCCLGVLAELYCQETGEKFPIKQKCLSGPIMKWANIYHVLGNYVWINGNFQELAHHNDEGVSFEQIANAIHQQL